MVCELIYHVLKYLIASGKRPFSGLFHGHGNERGCVPKADSKMEVALAAESLHEGYCSGELPRLTVTLLLQHTEVVTLICAMCGSVGP